MNTFTPERAAAVREALIAVAAAESPTRSRRTIWAALLVVGGIVAGAGGTAGAFAATGVLSPRPVETSVSSAYPGAIPAPPGVTPGSMLVTRLGGSFSVAFEGTTGVDVPDAPSGATLLEATVVPTAPGDLSIGVDSSGDNPRISATASDIREGSAGSLGFPIADVGETLYLDAEGMTGVVTLQWTVQVPTELGVNARGQTYGVMGAAVGEPDLVPFTGEAPDGSPVDGYVRTVDLRGMGDEGGEIPLFRVDGETQIGVVDVSR